jgi:hypothetical protein
MCCMIYERYNCSQKHYIFIKWEWVCVCVFPWKSEELLPLNFLFTSSSPHLFTVWRERKV